jgi:hypothetical protein
MPHQLRRRDSAVHDGTVHDSAMRKSAMTEMRS